MVGAIGLGVRMQAALKVLQSRYVCVPLCAVLQSCVVSPVCTSIATLGCGMGQKCIIIVNPQCTCMHVGYTVISCVTVCLSVIFQNQHCLHALNLSVK